MKVNQIQSSHIEREGKVKSSILLLDSKLSAAHTSLLLTRRVTSCRSNARRVVGSRDERGADDELMIYICW